VRPAGIDYMRQGTEPESWRRKILKCNKPLAGRRKHRAMSRWSQHSPSREVAPGASAMTREAELGLEGEALPPGRQTVHGGELLVE
jgi:hypothetical protein